MRKGFTLLELVVVVIILGVLATLGIQQYFAAVEKARGAEARTILGQIRSTAAAYRLERGNLDDFGNDQAGIGDGADQIPIDCTSTHYFEYEIISASGDTFSARASRCTANGKEPQASKSLTLQLTTNFAEGTDTWSGDY